MKKESDEFVSTWVDIVTVADLKSNAFVKKHHFPAGPGIETGLRNFAFSSVFEKYYSEFKSMQNLIGIP